MSVSYAISAQYLFNEKTKVNKNNKSILEMHKAKNIKYFKN